MASSHWRYHPVQRLLPLLFGHAPPAVWRFAGQPASRTVLQSSTHRTKVRDFGTPGRNRQYTNWDTLRAEMSTLREIRTSEKLLEAMINQNTILLDRDKALMTRVCITGTMILTSGLTHPMPAEKYGRSETPMGLHVVLDPVLGLPVGGRRKYRVLTRSDHSLNSNVCAFHEAVNFQQPRRYGRSIRVPRFGPGRKNQIVTFGVGGMPPSGRYDFSQGHRNRKQ